MHMYNMCMYLYMYMYMYVCVYMCVYVYVHIYIYTFMEDPIGSKIRQSPRPQEIGRPTTTCADV